MEAPQHPLQEQAEALGGQLSGLLTGWLDSGGGPASQAQLGNLLSMVRAGLAGTAAQGQAWGLLPGAAPRVTGLWLSLSTCPACFHLAQAAGHLHLQQRPGSQLANQLLSRWVRSLCVTALVQLVRLPS